MTSQDYKLFLPTSWAVSGGRHNREDVDVATAKLTSCCILDIIFEAVFDLFGDWRSFFLVLISRQEDYCLGLLTTFSTDYRKGPC